MDMFLKRETNHPFWVDISLFRVVRQFLQGNLYNVI